MIKNQKGQTLIEILIAVAAMGIAIVALLYGISNSVLAVNTVSNSRTAMNLARSQMEYIQAQSFDIADEAGDPNIYYLKLPQRSLPNEWLATDEIKIVPEQLSPYLQLVTVTVNYVNSDAVLEDYKPNHSPLEYAIFATSNAPNAIEIEGSGWRIQGDVLSESDITIAEGSDNEVNGDVSENADTSVISSPIDYTDPSQLGPPTFEFSGNNVNLNNEETDDNGKEIWVDWPNNTQLQPGIYYLDNGKIILSGSPDHLTTGNVTLIAEEIEITGDDLILSPYSVGILAYATKNNIDISSDNSIFFGALYAPEGNVVIENPVNPDNRVIDTTFNGVIVAKEIDANGENSSIGF